MHFERNDPLQQGKVLQHLHTRRVPSAQVSERCTLAVTIPSACRCTFVAPLTLGPPADSPSLLSNVVVSIQGNLNLPSNVSYVQSVVANSKIYPGYCRMRSQASLLRCRVNSQPFTRTGFTVKLGSNIVIEGNKNKKQGWIEAHGQQVRSREPPRLDSVLGADPTSTLFIVVGCQ